MDEVEQYSVDLGMSAEEIKMRHFATRYGYMGRMEETRQRRATAVAYLNFIGHPLDGHVILTLEQIFTAPLSAWAFQQDWS